MDSERMIRIEFVKLIFDERRDPIRIPAINLPRKPNENHELLSILYFFNPEFMSCHPDSLLPRHLIK
jgi:hypothetical protein